MYLEHFGLSDYPFSIAPDPSVFYLSEHHQRALKQLHYGIQRRVAFYYSVVKLAQAKLH